jgi:hypothetical protein
MPRRCNCFWMVTWLVRCAGRRGLSGVNLLYSWKRKLLSRGGPAAMLLSIATPCRSQNARTRSPLADRHMLPPQALLPRNPPTSRYAVLPVGTPPRLPIPQEAVRHPVTMKTTTPFI